MCNKIWQISKKPLKNLYCYRDSANKWIAHLKGMEFNYYYMWRYFGLHDESLYLD